MQYYYVSSPYGFRIHPKSKLRQMHHGIDMAGTWQEEVRAPADGYVSFSGRNGSFGKSIKIVHKRGVTTLYGHLHRLKVRKGDFVWRVTLLERWVLQDELLGHTFIMRLR